MREGTGQPAGADPGRGHTGCAPPLKLEKKKKNLLKIVIFHTEYPKTFAPPSNWRHYFKCPPTLTWNPGSAPDRVNEFWLCHWESKENCVRTKKLVFCSSYNEPTLLQNLQKWSLACKERGTLLTCYPLWFMVKYDFKIKIFSILKTGQKCKFKYLKLINLFWV